MIITICTGSISFSQITWLGLGLERILAIYRADENTLEIMLGAEKKLDSILKTLRKAGKIDKAVSLYFDKGEI